MANKYLEKVAEEVKRFPEFNSRAEGRSALEMAGGAVLGRVGGHKLGTALLNSSKIGIRTANDIKNIATFGGAAAGGIHGYKSSINNQKKEQEKKASIMTSGLKRIGIGATVGAGIGAVAGGEDNRVKGALGGAVLGGAAGGLMGKVKTMSAKPLAITDQKVHQMENTQLLDKGGKAVNPAKLTRY